MITFTHYTKKYKEKVFDFIYNTMSEELIVDTDTLNKMTADLKDIEKNYINKNGGIWLAINEETDEIIATIAIREVEKEIGELKRFYVRKDYRSKKIGYKLYNIVEKYALDYNLKEIYLVSGKELTTAHKFYENNGWKKVSNDKGNLNILVRKNADLYKKELTLKIANNWGLSRIA